MTYVRVMSKDEKSDSNAISTISRREALSGVAIAGASLSSLEFVTGEVSALPTDHVSIIQGTKLVKQGDGSHSKVKLRKEVPADWYKDLTNAKQVYGKHQSALQNRKGVTETTLSAGRFGGRNATIQVTISEKAARNAGKSVSEVRGGIPESLAAVPVKVKVIEGVPQLGGNYDYDTNPPAAGTQVATSDATGTLGGRAKKGGEWHFMTCEHLWGSNPDVLYIDYDNSEIIGDAEAWDCYDDFAALKPTNGWDTTDAIVDSDDSVSAQMSEDGIWELEANYESVHKKGWKTGHTAGTVKGIGSATVYDSSCNNRDKQVKWGDATYDFGAGDSGSLVYKPDYNGEDWAVSLGAAEADIVFGTGCFHIEDLHGYHWG